MNTSVFVTSAQVILSAITFRIEDIINCTFDHLGHKMDTDSVIHQPSFLYVPSHV